jgi:hypothetical protein
MWLPFFQYHPPVIVEMLFKYHFPVHDFHEFQYPGPCFFLYQDFYPVSCRNVVVPEAQTCAGYCLSAISPAVYEQGCVVVIHDKSDKAPVCFVFPDRKGEEKQHCKANCRSQACMSFNPCITF